MKWEEYSISSFCTTSSGGTPNRSKPEYYGGNIPWVKSGELRETVVLSASEHITEQAIKESSAKVVPAGALLVAMYGATIGRVAYLGMSAATNQAVCNIVPDKSKADRQYLFYALRSKAREWIGRGAGGAQPNISQRIIRETKIPLPPLEEQKRIAAILDKADAIRKKRKQAIELTEQFLRSAFLDMFGGPITNPKNLEIGSIRDLVSEVKYGTSAKAGSSGKFPILRMGNITYAGGWDFSNLKYINISENEEEKYLVKRGDLLFNRTNSKELVGKSAVYRNADPMVFAGYLVRVRPNELATSDYIAGYLNSSHGKATLQHMCKSIVGMANINAQELQNIKILISPIAIQEKYSKLVEAVYANLAKHCLIEENAHSLFNSLVQRAFRGEL